MFHLFSFQKLPSLILQSRYVWLKVVKCCWRKISLHVSDIISQSQQRRMKPLIFEPWIQTFANKLVLKKKPYRNTIFFMKVKPENRYFPTVLLDIEWTLFQRQEVDIDQMVMWADNSTFLGATTNIGVLWSLATSK